MSFVTLIIVKRNHVTILHHHYRVVQQLLVEGVRDIVVVKSIPEMPLDAGYIVLDMNDRTILNKQDAFALTTLPGFAVVQMW